MARRHFLAEAIYVELITSVVVMLGKSLIFGHVGKLKIEIYGYFWIYGVSI